MSKVLVKMAVLCLGLALCATVFLAQQDKAKRPSPPAQAMFDLGGGKTITIDYSSPRAKGRKIYGGLVPYGEVWRTGANESTTFVTNADLVVGGTTVPAGNYTLFTVPGKDKWQLVLSKKTGEWGTQYPGASNDLARIDMKVSTLPAAVENLTISFETTSMGTALNIDWETTRASVSIAMK